ncbi:MAG TPA: sigma 54-interacting transcriptional regulator, partial [Thermoanaerobaculia bacterium]
MRFLREERASVTDRFLSGSLPQEVPSGERPLRKSDTSAESAGYWWKCLFGLGGALAGQIAQVSALLIDPVTGLPGRAALEAAVSHELGRARFKNRALCLLLINPDGFAAVNERVGREAGDGISRDVAVRLRSVLRKSDLIAKYGGVVYAALLADTPLHVGQSVADKILHALTEAAFLNGTIRLDFSIGIAAFESGDAGIKQPPDLIRRADQALNAAKRSGGGRVEVWEPGRQAEGVGHDRLAGIFTGHMSRDYRNMALLWEAVNVMAATDDFEPLAARVVEGLHSAFLPSQVGVFGRSEKDEPTLIKGLVRQPGDTATTTPREMPDLGPEKRAFLQRAFLEKRMLQASFPLDATEGHSRREAFSYLVPLVARQQHLGGLYFEDPHPLDSSDLLFLQALAAQLALALDRARLAAEDRRRLEQEGRRLRAELDQLEEALQRAKLEYRSGQMEDVVATARRVAPTDATVLIMGESGTGKELLARTIHELSPRRNKPLIVVDCGSIAASIADSELFGHERGAYTGAQERKVGRLAEGGGGTVLLDEIGELPLEIQSKLLRFVQEKQITAVGGTHSRNVDVRIIAATNRDLASEVSAGRFREDLYHRLNVVRLVVPPLRARPDDILYLANLFLEKHSILHHKSVPRLTPESEALLLRHDWPGNVRELQNRLMQAVILCEKDELGPTELGLLKPSGEAAAGEPTPRGWEAQPRVERPGVESGSSRTGEDSSGPTEGVEQLLECLRAALAQQIESALNAKVPLATP